MERLILVITVTCFKIVTLNSLWPRDAIRQHRSESTLAPVLRNDLAPSHCLNHCWLSPKVCCGNHVRAISPKMLNTISELKNTLLNLLPHLSGAIHEWVKIMTTSWERWSLLLGGLGSTPELELELGSTPTPELELELELKPPELELELIFKRLAGVGVETPGVGIGVETLGSWSWNWSWNFVKFFLYYSSIIWNI